MRADEGARRLAENLRAAAGARVHSGGLELFDHVLVRHLVEAREVVKLDHRPSLQVKLRVVSFERRKKVCEITEWQLRVQSADDVKLGRAFFQRFARDAK